MQVLILGCGDIGTRVGLTLVDSGWCVAAARRQSGRLPECFEPFEIDLTDPKCFEVFSVLRPDYVVVTPTPQTYDPEGMLMRRVRSGVGGAAGGQYGNRIHREDLARLIVHCLLRDASGHEAPPTLIAADHDTTPTHEIESWLASQLGVTLERAETSQRQPANRRCQNALLGQIGFSLSYPTWREGYKAALEALGQSIRA